MDNKELTPKIRFAGFTDPWEQRKLGDVCQVTMGQSPDGSTYSDAVEKTISTWTRVKSLYMVRAVICLAFPKLFLSMMQ